MTTLEIGGGITFGGGISVGVPLPPVVVYDITTQNDLQLITQDDNNITTE